MPGKVADYLRAADPDGAGRAALDHGVTVRRGQGYTIHVARPPRHIVDSSPAASPSTAPSMPQRSPERMARREYENRVNIHVADTRR